MSLGFFFVEYRVNVLPLCHARRVLSFSISPVSNFKRHSSYIHDLHILYKYIPFIGSPFI